MTDREKRETNKQATHFTRCTSYFDLFRCATPRDKLYIYVALFLSIIAGCTTPIDAYIFGSLLQSISNYGKATKLSTEDDETLLNALIVFAVCECLLGFVLIATSYGSTVLLNMSAFNQVYRIRVAYFRAALNQDFEYYDTHPSGDFAVKMNADIIKLEDGIGEKLGLLFFSQASFISAVTVALYLGWKLALLCLVSLPVTVALFVAAGMISSRLSKKEAAVSSKAGAVAEEVLGGIRTVYAFSGQKKEVERYKRYLKDSKNINIQRGFFNGLSMGFLYLSISSAYALSMWFSYYLMVNEPDTYDVATVIAIFLGVMVGSESFSASSTLMEIFGIATGAGVQIFKLLDQVPKINPLRDNGLKLEYIKGHIKLNEVFFKYPSRPDVPVLNGITLEVKEGQSVALVGHSGSGKSTVIQLISRYYDVISGNVTVDGHDIRGLSVCWLRQQIGLVGQEPVLFNTTVRENIRYGRSDASDADIIAAAKQAYAHKFIVRLSKGYDTLVGEQGASLSGGQKQRIAIARAVIRTPRILLLDEATSALDTRCEAMVQKALDKAKIGRSTIIVAHRLTTIKNVDMIYVFKTGTIVEQGNHDELMAKKGLYYDMVNVQSHHTTVSTMEFNTLLTRDESSTSVLTVNEVVEKSDSQLEELPESPYKVTFWKVLMLNRPEWKSALVGTICSLASGFGMPAFCVVIGSFLGILSSPNTDEIRAEIIKFSIIFVIIGVISGILNFFIVYMYTRAGEQLTERLRAQMFETLLQQEIGFYDDKENSTGSLCAKLSGEAALVQGATGQRVGTIFGAVGTFVISLAVSLYYEWRVGLIALIFIPILVFVVIKEEQMTHDKTLGPDVTMEKSSKVAVEAITNIRTVASLGREEGFVKLYSDQLLPGLNEAKRTAHMRGLVFGLSRGLFNFIMAAALFYGGTLIISERMKYGNVIISAQALLFGSTAAAQVLAFAPNFSKGIRAAGRIIVILRRNPLITEPLVPAMTDFQGSGEASLNMVQFSYPSRPETLVLKRFNLDIERGKTFALVGSSGSGKSTVIQLLERFYDPNEGTVCLDNIPLPQLQLNDVRQSMSLVRQEPTLFDRTIKENIAYGDNAKDRNMNEIIEAAEQANIHQFILSLPEGYETNIGAQGVQLSGGQKQRIAIARALLRQPKLLLLDEATSALDTASEKVVQEALDRAKAGRTCVTIAHRLSTIRDADLICVVQSGRIVERGTHEELLRLNGLYTRLSQ